MFCVDRSITSVLGDRHRWNPSPQTWKEIEIRGYGFLVFCIWFEAVGILAMTVGLYYVIFRIKCSDYSFIVYPGARKYEIRDIVSWKKHEDCESQPGYQRRLELQFRPWYRRYLLLEEEITSQVFDRLLEKLMETHPNR
jgi:hypothetical protein